MELTKTDRAIIEKLREDARQSNRAVAKALAISEETVRRRTHAMVEARVIRFGIKISARQVGYDVPAMLTIKLHPGDLLPTVDIFSDAIIIESVNLTVDHRLVIRIAATDVQAIHKQVDFIRRKGYAEDVSVDIFHNETGWYI